MHGTYGEDGSLQGLFELLDVAYLHARDLVLDWPRYLLNYLVEFFRKLVRHV